MDRSVGRPAARRELPPEPLKAYRIWVTCQTDDDLPYVLKYAGEDNIVVGTDYGHQDQSSEIEAMRVMREKGEVDPRVIIRFWETTPWRSTASRRVPLSVASLDQSSFVHIPDYARLPRYAHILPTGRHRRGGMRNVRE